MEGIVIKALNKFTKHGGSYVIAVPIGTFYVAKIFYNLNLDNIKITFRQRTAKVVQQ